MDDKPKPKYAPGQSVTIPGAFGTQNKFTRQGEAKVDNNPFGFLAGMLNSPVRAGANFLGDLVRGNLGSTEGRVGTGWGDYLLGTTPGAYNDWNAKAPAPKKAATQTPFGNLMQAPQQQEQGQQRKTLADYFQYAVDLLGGGSGNAPGRVNYDSERNTLRQNYGDADARLAAMYRQLGDSIAADAPAIQQAYQGGIQQTQENAKTSQASSQAATDAANSHNDQVLANLGISDAQKQIIGQGRDLSTQTAKNITGQQQKAQAAADLLASNQATALAHNTNLKGAAGLEGAMQRAQAQSKLAALLSQIDSREQDANAQLAAQGASAWSNTLSQALDFAKAFYDSDPNTQQYQDKLGYQSAQLALKTPQQKVLPDLGTYLQALGIDPAELSKNPRDYGSLLSALRGFNITQ